uniref:Uncharacterized protein n=1 Tax=Candidatus Kentrum sp. MB TaxID=2138164 RepID=A0A450XCS0_9GAMM|nr:MAG: hypothetical protein BECKMB1821G_GA0114241_102512 [Candidatus Kentron sp. MB]
MLALFECTWREVVAEEERAVRDTFFKKVWDDISAFRVQLDIRVSHAFLPRRGKNSVFG